MIIDLRHWLFYSLIQSSLCTLSLSYLFFRFNFCHPSWIYVFSFSMYLSKVSKYWYLAFTWYWSISYQIFEYAHSRQTLSELPYIFLSLKGLNRTYDQSAHHDSDRISTFEYTEVPGEAILSISSHIAVPDHQHHRNHSSPSMLVRKKKEKKKIYIYIYIYIYIFVLLTFHRDNFLNELPDSRRDLLERRHTRLW